MSLVAAASLGLALSVPLPVVFNPDVIRDVQISQVQASLPAERLAAVGADGKQIAAVMRGIDKITARPTKLVAPVNQPIIFGTLKITVRYCRQRPPEETPETFVFLEIVDQGIDGTTAPRKMFSGWMFASSPAISALEHPVYNVSVISCTALAPESSPGTAKKSP